MPIQKDGNGVIQYTDKIDKFESDSTGVHQSNSFFVADNNDQLKQVKFDSSEQATNTTVVLKTKAASPNGTVTITFPDVDTTLGAGGAGASFTIIQPDSGTSPTATGSTDTLTLTSANNRLTISGNSATDTITFTVNESNIDHGSIAGLSDDDHAQYALLAGRVGGQTLNGGNAASETLTLTSTAHATKGAVVLGQSVKEFSNGRLVVGDITGSAPSTNNEITMRARGGSGRMTLVSSGGQDWHLYPSNGNLQICRSAFDVTGIGLDTSSRFYTGDGSPLAMASFSNAGSTNTSIGALSASDCVVEIRNRSNTASNFSGLVFEGQGTAWDVGLFGIHTAHTSGSQTGYLEVWATTSGTRTKALTVKSSDITHNIGVSFPFVTKTGAYTITDSDYYIAADASGGAFTLTLPTAVGRAGKTYVIKRINTGPDVTLATTSSQTIDGSATKLLGTQWVSRTVFSDGSNWLLI